MNNICYLYPLSIIADGKDLLHMAWWGFAFLILIVCITFSWIRHISRQRESDHGKFWEWIENHLPLLFSIAWAYSFIIYFVGSFIAGKDLWTNFMTALSVVPMSLVYATESFVGASDISAIYEDRHESWLYMVFFDTSHLFSVMVSLCFVIKHTGYYAVSKYRYWIEVMCSKYKTYKDIFVFWGVNETSYCLAKSTANALKGNNYLIIFVKTPLEDIEDSKTTGLDTLLNFVTMKENEIKRLEALENSIITTAHHRLTALHLESQANNHADILSGKLKMKSLAKLLHRANGHIHLFFLDNEQNDNISATANILYDTTLLSKQLTIYCLARKNSKTAWLEHYGLLHPKENTSIHVVDSSALSIYQLKKNEKYHPVNYIRWDTSSAVPSTKLSSLIIGFHETGKEALKFIYEFGTFVDNNANRIPGKYTVMDSEMENYSGDFFAKKPALENNDELQFIECSIGDKVYWHKLKELLPGLNYVIICVGDDDLGINAAVDICRMAYNNISRDPNAKLTVFVRSYDANNIERLKNVQDDINHLCGDKISIEIFGSLYDIFTYELIIDDRITKEAKVYNYFYRHHNGQNRNEISPAKLDEEWNTELGINVKLDKEYKLADILDIDRKRDNNIENSLHGATKIKILKICDSLKPSDKMKLHLAQLEHERWVAYSKFNGWNRLTYDQGMELAKKSNSDVAPVTRDTVHKLHADICPWNEIRNWNSAEQKKVQEYDIRVIETTLFLNKKYRVKK